MRYGKIHIFRLHKPSQWDEKENIAKIEILHAIGTLKIIIITTCPCYTMIWLVIFSPLLGAC